MDLILLHGALGCSSHWDAMASLLEKDHRLFKPDFPGHGRSVEKAAESIFDLSGFLSDYIRKNNLENPYILGYSMGGYVALHALIHHKIKLSGLLTIATKMNWSPEIAEKEVSRLNWDTMSVIREKLESEHGDNLDRLFENTASIMNSIGKDPIINDDLKKIDVNFVMSVGERDKMVSWQETEVAAAQNPLATSKLLTGQGHSLEKMDTHYLYDFVKQLLK